MSFSDDDDNFDLGQTTDTCEELLLKNNKLEARVLILRQTMRNIAAEINIENQKLEARNEVLRELTQSLVAEVNSLREDKEHIFDLFEHVLKITVLEIIDRVVLNIEKEENITKDTVFGILMLEIENIDGNDENVTKDSQNENVTKDSQNEKKKDKRRRKRGSAADKSYLFLLEKLESEMNREREAMNREKLESEMNREREADQTRMGLDWRALFDIFK